MQYSDIADVEEVGLPIGVLVFVNEFRYRKVQKKADSERRRLHHDGNQQILR